MLKEAIADIESKLTQMNKATGDRFWPVNSIYITMDERNPYDIMGFGTWMRFSAGRTLVGTVKESDPGGQIVGGLIPPGGFSVGTAGAIFGDYTHTITQEEMPAHSHDYGGYGGTSGGGGVAAGYDRGIVARTRDRGGNQPHNNTQPSTVVHMWRRIA